MNDPTVPQELLDELEEARERIQELEHELRTQLDNPGYHVEGGVLVDRWED